ncbi:hypothetical protein ACFPM0_28060 [Pseudonocardia sulfidoxydans]|uniref:hypothetical protein n=1 Tax=Pseudonocardia sulfidoxydans TaxID=54011 RepID=UPI0036196030
MARNCWTSMSSATGSSNSAPQGLHLNTGLRFRLCLKPVRPHSGHRRRVFCVAETSTASIHPTPSTSLPSRSTARSPLATLPWFATVLSKT